MRLWLLALLVFCLPVAAEAACPTASPTTGGVSGSPFGNNYATTLDKQTSDNVRITGGCIDVPNLQVGGAGAMNVKGSNATLPDALQNLFGNSTGQIYYADFANGAVSGAQCAGWTNPTTANKVDDCINGAIAAAETAGGYYTVSLPSSTGLAGQTYYIGDTIGETAGSNGRGVYIVGSGGVGSGGRCGTQLTWAGADGGTMLQFAPSTGQIYGPQLRGVCLNGNATTLGHGAGTGIKLRGVVNGKFIDTYVGNTQVDGWDVDANDGAANQGSSQLYIRDAYISQGAAGAINANGFHVGRSSTTFSNDTFHSTFQNMLVQYQNGTAFLIGASDKLHCWNCIAQPVNGGTGVSLEFQGASGGSYFANADDWHGAFGNGTASTRPLIDSGASQITIEYTTIDGELSPTDNSGTATARSTDGETTTHAVNGYRMPKWIVGWDSTSPTDPASIIAHSEGTGGNNKYLDMPFASRIRFGNASNVFNDVLMTTGANLVELIGKSHLYLCVNYDCGAGHIGLDIDSGTSNITVQSGYNLNINGAKVPGSNVSKTQPSNPIAGLTTVGTDQYFGLSNQAGTQLPAFTPNTTGNVVVTFSGTSRNTVINDGGRIQIFYGTGTAPVNAATATVDGTHLTCSQREPNPGAVPAAAQDYPWSITCAATGLTNGTAYWFDVAASPLVGGTYSIGNLTVVYREE